MPRNNSSGRIQATKPADNHPQRAWLTPPEVGRRYGIKAERVISMIRAGLIRAIDVASPGSRRPRFRIHEADLIAFEVSREVKPASKKVAQKRRSPMNVIEFF
jgi:hypothetical protein